MVKKNHNDNAAKGWYSYFELLLIYLSTSRFTSKYYLEVIVLRNYRCIITICHLFEHRVFIIFVSNFYHSFVHQQNFYTIMIMSSVIF